jgi:hypothetical protein
MNRAAVIALAMLVATPALAANPAYVGTWGVSAAQCKVPQDQQGAPMVMAARRFDSHEAHCTFTSVKRVGGAWRIATRCSVEGDKQAHIYAVKVTGNVLTMTDTAGARSYKRCR